MNNSLKYSEKKKQKNGSINSPFYMNAKIGICSLISSLVNSSLWELSQAATF